MKKNQINFWNRKPKLNFRRPLLRSAILGFLLFCGIMNLIAAPYLSASAGRISDSGKSSGGIRSDFAMSEGQQIRISGTVTDGKGATLPGATVQVKGTSQGVLTDGNGKYSIDVASSEVTLAFSFVGYTLKEVAVQNQTSIDVVLSEDLQSLAEVVVIGYGTVQKKDLTGSVGQMQANTIKDLPVVRVDQALTGKLSGVQVLTTSGKPGASTTIRIRGVGSISAGTDPLYVVDGYPIDNIDMLNPNDIETIDILKDASATAIYGSRGANGVILINTKRGKSGKSIISLDTYFGWQKILKSIDFLTMDQQAQYYYDGVVNQNKDAGKAVDGDPTKWFYAVPQTIMDVLNGNITTPTDAYSAIFRIAPQQSYNLSAKGGNENVKYSVSAEYLNQEGIVLSSNFNRYSVRANLDAQLSKKLSMKFNFNTAYTTNNDIVDSGGNGGGEGIIGSATTWQYWYPLYQTDGSYFSGYGQDATNNVWNPIATANEVLRKAENLRLLGNLNTEYKFSNTLKLNVMLGANIGNRHYYYFIPKMDVFQNVAEGDDERSSSLNWITESTLNYTKSFGSHNFTGLIGYTTQKQSNGSNFVSSRTYPNNLVYTLNAVSNILYQGSSDVSEWTLISYLARINYNFKNRYYLTASIRSDGSSRFGKDKKFGYFPSAALAWRVSDESFLKDVSFISDFKLRTSYGETGNNNIGNYAHIATINYESYDLGGVAVGGFAPSRFANSQLTWEKQKSLNFGLDFSILNSRVSLTVDYFKTINHNLLLDVNVPLITGFNTSLQNIGEVENRGWEFALNTVNLAGGNFEWNTNFNLSTFNNEVLKLGPEGAPIISGNNITQIGSSMGMFYGYLTDGVFKTQAELDAGPKWAPGTADVSRLGDIRFKDISGPDGVPDNIINTYDRTIMGNPYPDFYYGMTNNFSYRNFTLSVALQGSVGNEILNSSDNMLYTRARYKQLSIVKDYWKSEAEPGNDPRPNNLPTGGLRQYSNRFITDASYFKINNINLSYLFPEKISRKIYLSSLRVYVSATNPLLVTDYLYFNPETSSSTSSLTPGLLNYNYPIAKSFIIGINASF
jgi:TonB-linked SusC/RagA family outer membrane protein